MAKKGVFFSAKRYKSMKMEGISSPLIHRQLKLCQFKQLDTLQFNPKNEEPLKYQRIASNLTKKFAVCKNMKNIYLSFQRNSDIANDKTVKSLISTLKASRKIQSLSVNFTSCLKISDKCLISLRKLISCLKDIKILSLNLTLCRKITQDALMDLFYSCSEPPALEILNLKLSSLGTITDKGIYELTDSLKKMCQLKSLILDLSMCANLTEKGISYFSTSFPSLKNLEHFTLSLDRCEPSVQNGFQPLFKELKALENLLSLTLDFTGFYEIKEQAFSQLDITFFKTKLLKKLELSFFGSKIDDKGLEKLGNSFTRLVSLERLRLECGIEGATDLGLQKLSHGIGKLKQLREVTILIDKSQVITGQGLGWIAAALASLEFMERVELLINSLPQMKDFEFKEIGRNLSRSNHLSYLRVSFTGCYKVTGQGLMEFARHIAEMKKLTSLRLDCQSNIEPTLFMELEGVLFRSKSLVDCQIS